MKLMINGHDKLPVRRIKGSDQSFNCLICSDTGGKIDLTANTIDVLVYDNGSRSGTALLTASGASAVATAGSFTIDIADTDLASVAVGADLYAFARLDTGALITISDNPILLENR